MKNAKQRKITEAAAFSAVSPVNTEQDLVQLMEKERTEMAIEKMRYIHMMKARLIEERKLRRVIACLHEEKSASQDSSITLSIKHMDDDDEDQTINALDILIQNKYGA